MSVRKRLFNITFIKHFIYKTTCCNYNFSLPIFVLMELFQIVPSILDPYKDRT